MKKTSLKTGIVALKVFMATFSLTVISVFLLSFSVHKMADDFLKQLGISKTDADKKITNSLLGGYIDTYGIRNAKNIALGKRSAVAMDLLAYVKKQATGAAFIKEYNSLREGQKPLLRHIETPEERQQTMIAENKKYVSNFETMLKKADASYKPTVEKMLADARKGLKEAENPNNKELAAYRKEGYPKLVKDFEASYRQELSKWETDYPANHLLFVKKRLEQFLGETKDIDFSAELVTKNGKKYFANKTYEGKSYRWKMAFRAGKEVIEPARAFVQQWIAEIK